LESAAFGLDCPSHDASRSVAISCDFIDDKHWYENTTESNAFSD
jgi:hypothetical protein